MEKGDKLFILFAEVELMFYSITGVVCVCVCVGGGGGGDKEAWKVLMLVLFSFNAILLRFYSCSLVGAKMEAFSRVSHTKM